MLGRGLNYFADTQLGATGVAFVLAGKINKRIRLLESAIEAADARGDRNFASWNRLILADVYLEMLASRTMPPLSVILKNLNAIVSLRMSGARRIKALLEQAGNNPQVDERGTIRAHINMNIGLVHKIEKAPDRARQFLAKARGPAELQGATLMVAKIDSALAELQ
jgi:hypothetical protein